MKRQKQKINYPTEIDAAYYALHRFISPYDYVVRYIGEDLKPVTATVNPNCIIVGRLSKLNFFRPIPVGKGHFQSHFKRDEILFYKSNPDSPYFTGFGRYDKEALKLPFAKDLHITTHKKIDKNYNILLVGIDIDCHNNEQHVGEVEALIRHYLPDTYWEPSTGGKGRHGYLKLKYKNSYGVIATISSALKKLFAELNTLKNLYGYQAKIDDPAGLPFKLECVTENPYENNWKTLHYITNKEPKFLGRHINPDSITWKSYCSYLINDTIYHLHSDCLQKPSLLNQSLTQQEIESTFSVFYNRHIDLFSPAKDKFFKITVQRAFKLPFFGATETETETALPKMENIQQFHSLPYLTSQDLQRTYNLIQQDIIRYPEHKLSIQASPITVNSIPRYIINSHAAIPCSENEPIPVKGGYQPPALDPTPKANTVYPPKTGDFKLNLLQIKKQERKGNNCVYTTHTNLEEKSIKTIKSIDYINWQDCKESENSEFNIDLYWKLYHQHSVASKKFKYEDSIEFIKLEDNSFKRTSLFVQAYIQKLKYIPTIDEAEAEYVSVGVNRNPQQTTQNRRKRLRACLRYYKQQYDASKTGYVAQWRQESNEVINIIAPYMQGKELNYTHGNRPKSVLLEEVAFVYYCICQMERTEQKSLLAHSLSYKAIDALFLKQFGKCCGKNKCAAILRFLMQKKLIQKVGNYKVGLRGNCYRAIGPVPP